MLYGGCLAFVTNRDQIPIVGMPGEGECFDISLDWAMQHDTHLADMLKIGAIVNDFAAVAVSWKFDGVEATSPLEAGIAWRLACLNTAKEGLKRFI